MHRSRWAKHAFSLIELLAAAAILAVLAGLLLPVLSRARSSARGAVCLSNLRNLGVAIALYRSDYDGLAPYGLDPRSLAARAATFEEPYFTLSLPMPDLRTVMAAYVPAGPVYECPSEHPFDGQAWVGTFFERFGSSYSYDAYPAMLCQPETWYRNPSSAFLMADIDFWHAGSYFGDGRMNELFADYHAKNVSWDAYLESVVLPSDVATR